MQRKENRMQFFCVALGGALGALGLYMFLSAFCCIAGVVLGKKLAMLI
jgi:hypothetical protein